MLQLPKQLGLVPLHDRFLRLGAIFAAPTPLLLPILQKQIDLDQP
jgi:hypothetical protein